MSDDFKKVNDESQSATYPMVDVGMGAGQPAINQPLLGNQGYPGMPPGGYPPQPAGFQPQPGAYQPQPGSYYGQPISYQQPFVPMNPAGYVSNYTPQMPAPSPDQPAQTYNPFAAQSYQQYEGVVQVPCYKCYQDSSSNCGVNWTSYKLMSGCGRYMCDQHNCSQQGTGPDPPFRDSGICQECIEHYNKIYWRS